MSSRPEGGADRRQEVLRALATVNDPDLGRDIVALGFVKNLEIGERSVACDIELTTPACPVKEQMQRQAEAAVRALGWADTVAIRMTAQVRAPADAETLTTVKHVIAVASGKGGVGKSTVAVNMACALSQAGAKVGLLDADIYGPSVPHMIGMGQTQPKQRQVDGKPKIVPFEKFGLKIMSMGFLIEPDKPIIWRGPMLHGALNQFFADVDWGDLDYLVIDLPPGTGDVQLTLAQKTRSNAVIVSTPQDVAMLDARKALGMFRTTSIPVLGIIENMSDFACPSCGHHTPIFGNGGAKAWSEREGLRFLGAIPIDVGVRIHGDDGVPALMAEDSPKAVVEAFRGVAEQAAAELSKQQLTRTTAPKKLELHNH